MGEHYAAFDEEPLERPNWFQGRVLTSADLDLQQTYVRERMRRRNRLLHGWGVVSGLDATASPGLALRVEPGFALDAAGNEIIVPARTVIDAQQAGLEIADATYWLAVRWDECPAGAVVDPRLGGKELAAGWVEDFELKLLDVQPPDEPPTPSRGAAPWLALATVVWDGHRELVVDATVRRTITAPVTP